MKKLLAATCVLAALSVPTYAGDIPGTGKQDPPPPCTENCSATSSTQGEKEATDTIIIPIEFLELVLTLLTF